MSSASISAVLAGRVPLDEVATVNGWVKTRRDSKAGFSFLAISDGSCFDSIQIVAPNSLPNYTSEILQITTGCAVTCTGKLVRSQGKGQAIEMQADRVQVLGWVENPDAYPVSAKHHTFEYLREVAHLRPRTNTFGAVTRVRHALAMATHRFFHENGFYWIHTPIVTASDAEGAGAMFRVSTLDLANLPKTPAGQIDFAQDFFGRPTFLTVSGQLNVEAYCLAMSKVYTFGPTFRAEQSFTPRHLAEFWMIEPEIAFADLAANADLAEALLKSIFRAVLNERQDDLKFFAERIDKECIARVEKFVESSFDRITYTDAVKILEQSGKNFEFPVKWGLDLQIRARALPHRAHRPAGGRDELPERHQGVLHAPQRRRENRRSHGRARSGDRRNHRRLAARGAPRHARPAHGCHASGQAALLLVSRPAPLRNGAARRLRPRLRADHSICDGHDEHPRRDSVSARAEERGLLAHCGYSRPINQNAPVRAVAMDKAGITRRG